MKISLRCDVGRLDELIVAKIFAILRGYEPLIHTPYASSL